VSGSRFNPLVSRIIRIFIVLLFALLFLEGLSLNMVCLFEWEKNNQCVDIFMYNSFDAVNAVLRCVIFMSREHVGF